MYEVTIQLVEDSKKGYKSWGRNRNRNYRLLKKNTRPEKDVQREMKKKNRERHMDTLTMSEIVKTDKKRERECPCTNKRETHSLSLTQTQTQNRILSHLEKIHIVKGIRERKSET